MSAGLYLSRRVNELRVQDGYESPMEGGSTTTAVGNLRELDRRLGYFADSHDSQIEPAKATDSNDTEHIGSQTGEQLVRLHKKVSLRERLSCFSWMWFTMVVLHFKIDDI